MSYKTFFNSKMQKTHDKTQNSAKDSVNSQNDNTTRFSYVSQKTQRLASALYAITRSFPADEPLRTTLRNQALSLITTAHELPASDTNGSGGTRLPILLGQLRSQLAVAADGGLISAGNRGVLDEEISRFIDEIKDISAISGPHLDNGYFTDNTTQPALSSGHTEEGNTSPTGSSSLGERSGGSTATSNAKKLTPSPQVSAKNKRRQKILDLFDDQDKITVNDVTDIISGYSTKTVQRDLKALVKEGVLEKHGKRRWTHYTLV